MESTKAFTDWSREKNYVQQEISPKGDFITSDAEEWLLTPSCQDT